MSLVQKQLEVVAGVARRNDFGYSRILLAPACIFKATSLTAQEKERARLDRSPIVAIWGGGVSEQSIEKFLAEVERKAYRMAEIATQNSADALDIVQDAMIKLVDKYAHKPAVEWRPLFYRILQHRITDHFRRKTLHQRLFFWRDHPVGQVEQDACLLDSATDHIGPERELSGQRNMVRVLDAIKQLPLRQQQCFLLRNWEGLSVAETALAMGCSEGSVKTHYSRAKEALQGALLEECF